MNPLRRYYHFVDGCLAGMVGEDVHSVERRDAWNDMIVIPILIFAIPAVLLSLLVNLFGLAEVWRLVGGSFFIALTATHGVIAFWRWSVFDYEEFTGKKLAKRYEDFW